MLSLPSLPKAALGVHMQNDGGGQHCAAEDGAEERQPVVCHHTPCDALLNDGLAVRVHFERRHAQRSLEGVVEVVGRGGCVLVEDGRAF